MEELVKKSIDDIINEHNEGVLRPNYSHREVKHLMTKAQHETHKRYNWNKNNSMLINSMLDKYRSIQPFVYPLPFMSKLTTDKEKWTLDELMIDIFVDPKLLLDINTDECIHECDKHGHFCIHCGKANRENISLYIKYMTKYVKYTNKSMTEIFELWKCTNIFTDKDCEAYAKEHPWYQVACIRCKAKKKYMEVYVWKK